MESTNDSKKKLIICGSIIGVILVLLIATIGVLGANSKNLFTTYFDKGTKLIDEAFKKSDKLTEKKTKFGVNGKISFDLDLNDNLLDDSSKKIQEAVNDTEFSYEIKMDQEEKLIQVVLAALKNNEELINLDVVAIDDKGYIKIKDIVDKYYQFDLDQEVNFDVDTEELEMLDEIEVLYNIAKKDIRKNLLSKKNISTSKEKIEIGGEEVSVKKHTLTITEEVAYKTVVAVLEDILNSEEALEALVKISNTQSSEEYTVDSMKKEIENVLDQFEKQLDEIKNNKEENNTDGTMIVNIYTKGKEVVKAEVGTLYSEKLDVQLAVEIDEIEKNKKEYTLLAQDEKVAKITVTEKGKSEYSIEINLDENDVKVVFDGTIKEDEINLTYSLSAEGQEIKGTLYAKEENSEKYEYKFSIEMKEFGKIAVNAEMNINNKFDIPDVSEATTDIDSDEVQEKLMNKAQQIMDKLGIDINELMGISDEIYSDVEDLDLNLGEYEGYNDNDYDDIDDTDWGEMFQTMEY